MRPHRAVRATGVAVFAALAACGDAPTDERAAPATGARDAAPSFADVAAERGLSYVNRSGQPTKATILEANGAGSALLDLGGDGDLDVVFAQGCESLAALLAGPGADLEVFANDGDGRFERVAGPGLGGWWTGLATGDVDGDGDTDLVAAAYGDLVLCVQDADGTLVPRYDAGLAPTGRPGARLVPGEPRAAGSAPAWASSVALFDLERDGDLDLYVGQYLELDPLDPPLGEVGEGVLAIPCTWKGHAVYCGPHGLVPQPDRVLVNDGRGTFRDETASRLPDHVPGYTLGVVPFDADADGDSDLYVANDSVANLMLVSDGGVLRDAALAAGVAVGADGEAEAGMGVATGDVDRDGLVDLAVTNFSDEPTHLYVGAARGFRVETFRRGLGNATRRLLSWGVHLEDFDGDGWLELFTANGHVYPQADADGTGTSYGQPDSLWRLGPGEIALPYELPPGDALSPALGTRGSSVGDLDGDGAAELVLVHLDAPAGLALNRLGAASRRVVVRCEGPREPAPSAPRTPRDALGTRVGLTFDDPSGGGAPVTLWREIQSASGYQSASSPHARFGLGAAQRYAQIEVRWPSGRVERLGAGEAGRVLVVREGEGVVDAWALD